MLRQWDVLSGYSEAMAVYGSRLELLAFAIVAGLLLAFAAWAEAKAARSEDTPFGWGLLRVVGLALVVFMLFKAGFVRQDLHTLIAWNGLAMTAVLALWARYQFWARSLAIVTMSAALAVVLVVCPAIMISAAPLGPGVAAATEFYDAWLVREPIDQLEAALAALVNPRDFAANLADGKRAALTDITDLFPLPKLEGRVDTIPSMQSRIIANGLDYAPGRASRNTRPTRAVWPRPTEGSSKGRWRQTGFSSVQSRAETI